jgi:alpha-L-fucosidase
MNSKILTIIALLVAATQGFAHEDDNRYFPETDSLVLEKIEAWQDLKFGLLMHWGPYSQWGIVESWSICPEDYDWCERKKGRYNNYFDYLQDYRNLKNTFNPVHFEPEKWADAAAAAGMRYVVFTTKHHDGFSMFDSEFTTFKITDPGCPFSSNPRADVTREIFDAFRAKNMWTGAYFSKPDWNNEYYWDPYFPPMDRNVNYDPARYPEKWENFVQFTHNQIMELCTKYGDIDILWLDGGWVRKYSDQELLEIYTNRLNNLGSGFVITDVINQDIRMDELVEKSRVAQPGLIVVDRAVPGKNQNYLTPENRVPDQFLPYPWESCIIAGGSWSWIPDPRYMSTNSLVHLLVDIVAKGGNLLLNIAPGPDGRWDEGAYDLLSGMAEWMSINSEAIYETRAIEPYKEGRVCFTSKNDGSIYAIYLAEEHEHELPATVFIPFDFEDSVKVSLLGSQAPLSWEKTPGGINLNIPSAVRNQPPCSHAWVFHIQNTL